MSDVKPWVQTFSGVAFDLMQPKPEQVLLIDIAHHLSRIARYNGATKGAHGWNVAQHSLLVEQLLPDDASSVLRLHALLHDAHEAYVGDTPAPVKQALDMFGSSNRFGSNWSALCAGIDIVVWQAFGLAAPTQEERQAIAAADLAALFPERASLMAPAPRDWHLPPDAAPVKAHSLTPLPPDEAKAAFIERIKHLLDQRHGIRGGEQT
jgi:5'-deoxynucleotidase YfbR-like HD superfamily hydrolase